MVLVLVCALKINLGIHETNLHQVISYPEVQAQTSVSVLLNLIPHCSFLYIFCLQVKCAKYRKGKTLHFPKAYACKPICLLIRLRIVLV
jgi:hypothetical protein